MDDDVSVEQGIDNQSAGGQDADVAAFDAELAADEGAVEETPPAPPGPGDAADAGGAGATPEAGGSAAPTPAAPRRYKTPDGRELTVEELQQEGLLDLAWTHYGQVSTYQRKHEESAAKVKELEERLSRVEKPAQPEPEQPRITPDQLLTAMKPEVQQLVKGGWIEEDFAELYPMAAARQAAESRYMRTLLAKGSRAFHDRIAKLEGILGQVTEVTQLTERERMGQTLISRIMAGGEAFADLAKEEERAGFAEFVTAEGAGNLDPELVSDHVLQGLYLAYRAKKNPPAAPPPRRKASDQVRGDGAGGGRAPGAPMSEVEAFEREMIEAGRMLKD